MDRAELLLQMDAGRARLAAALAQISDQQMGDIILHYAWSVKDLLAHLGFWERRVVALYHALVNESAWENANDDDAVDELNARALQEGRLRSLAEVREEEAAAYHATLALVQSAPETDLFDPQRFSWTRGQPFYAWIEGNTFGHYEEHLPELQEWLKGQV